MQLGVEGVEAFEGPDRVALQDVPDRHAQFARHCHGRFIASAAGRHRQTPLAQRVLHLEEFFG